jgi:hypothetical protein
MTPPRDYEGPERRHHREDPITLGQLREAVQEAIESAVNKTFISLGIDLTDPEDLSRWYKDRAWIEQKRSDEERRLNAGIAGNVALRNGVITVLLSAIAAYLTAKLGVK